MFHPQTLFPLAAALVYAIAALFLNAAGRAGVRGRVTTAFCNGFLAIFLLGFYDWSSFPSVGSPAWPVVLLAVCFVTGQWLTILAFNLGEVSVVAPVMGLKVIFVSLMVAVGLREPLATRIWVAALLSVAGVGVLQARFGKQRACPHAFLSILCAFLSALAFAAADVVIQHWSPRLGFERFVPPSMVLAALLSLPLLLSKRQEGTAFPLPPATLASVVAGSVLLALQSLLLVFAIGRYGNVAQANILYSSRGVWSVILVWLVGHLFANTELGSQGTGRLFFRLLGALLISTAIVLAVQ